MTVRTHHLAFRDLVKDGLPIPVRKGFANVEQFLAQVIELEHHRIELSAVDARVLAEEAEQIPRALDGKRPFALSRLRDVSLAVGGVVLFSVGRPTGPAKAVPLTEGLSANRVGGYGLKDPAPAALP